MNAPFKHFVKNENKPLSLVTCYDTWSARIIDQTDIDAVLVGDSVAMVMHGHSTTLNATLEMMALHTQAVSRGLTQKLMISDLPFMTYRSGLERAMDSVKTLMQAGAHAVKIEGVWGHESIIESIIGSGVPVMGHIGLTPQSIYGLGGFKVQGKEEKAAQNLKKQALALEALGCFSIVLECVPSYLAEEITASLKIPTIGIGAGVETDGQILVLHDLLGMNDLFKPKFLREFMSGFSLIKNSLNHYHREVREKTYPSQTESYS